MPISESMKIFTGACDRLGIVLEQQGFKYLKSKRSATRKGILFDHVIAFSSSRSINSLEGHIHLEVKAMAFSEEYGNLRREKGIDIPFHESLLFGSTIENIFTRPPPYIRYDLGNVQERELVLNNIEIVLLEQVMKAFLLIESPHELERFLEKNDFPAMEHFNAVNDYFSYIKTRIN